MQDYPSVRLRAFGDATSPDLALLQRLSGGTRNFSRHDTIRREGEPPDHFFLLLEGWVSSSMGLSSDGRQIVKLHLAGDIIGMPSICLTRAAVRLTALTECRVAAVPTAALGTIFTEAPRLAAILFLCAQQERVDLYDRLAAMGRADAHERIAAFLLDLYRRLERTGEIDNQGFRFPLTQDQLSDIVGLTAVHVNRTLRRLDAEGIIQRPPGMIRILSLDRLAAASPLPSREPACEPDWLPPPESDAGAHAQVPAGDRQVA